ncbi:MAG: peptidylprolyl isomerase, partial [Candidatus Thermoplasmatota archaeon]|nr:peptidylprolyl isomerase [Candidatus Thermoplasmatota archaeon]
RKRSRPVEKQSFYQKNKSLVLVGLIVILIIIIAGVWWVLATGSNDNGNTEPTGNPIAVFDTSKGVFKVELFQDKVPKTCNNFIKLVNDGFYDGMIFYRIMDDFMIQAGRYLADGSEKSSPYGNIDFESDPTVRHVDGAISMASTGVGVGGSAEFFICDGPQSFLDDNYAAFGVVIEGMDVVRDIADEPQDNSSPAGGGKPYTDIIINSITIENL